MRMLTYRSGERDISIGMRRNHDRPKQDMPHDYCHRLSCQGLRDRDVSDLAHQPKYQARHQNTLNGRQPVDWVASPAKLLCVVALLSLHYAGFLCDPPATIPCPNECQKRLKVLGKEPQLAWDCLMT